MAAASGEPAQAGTAALAAWLRAEGGFVHPRVAAARVGRRRGLHVSPGARAVPAGAVLVRVPLRCCVAGACVGDVAKRFHAGWAAGAAREAAYASAVDWAEVCCVGEWPARRRRRERLDASLTLQDVCRADADANRLRNPALYKAHCLCMSRAFSFSAARGTVLVPVVDVMNHSVVGRNVSFSCDGDGAVVVRAAGPGGFPPGAAAELLCVYGELSPAQLVHDYSIPLHPRGAEFLHALRHYSAAPLLAACGPPPLLPAAAAPALSSPSALYLPRPFCRARLAALFGAGEGVRRRLRACARASLREGRRRVAAAVAAAAAAKRRTRLNRVSGALQGKRRRWRRRPPPVGLLVLVSECVGLRRLLRETRRAWTDADAPR